MGEKFTSFEYLPIETCYVVWDVTIVYVRASFIIIGVKMNFSDIEYVTISILCSTREKCAKMLNLENGGITTDLLRGLEV